MEENDIYSGVGTVSEQSLVEMFAASHIAPAVTGGYDHGARDKLLTGSIRKHIAEIVDKMIETGDI